MKEELGKARLAFPVAHMVWLLALILHAAPTAAVTPFPKAEGVDVASVFSDPFAYKGEINVRGAVMDADPAKKLFNIIDYREYRTCRAVNCAREWVTVLFEGKPPAVASVVEITGIIEKNRAGKGGFVLKAKTVAVARALVNDPDILMMDEPTGNLDSKSESELLDLIGELHEMGKTILVVTHSDTVANRAGRIIRIKDGRIESAEG